MASQTDLFEPPLIKYEYYPLLVPSDLAIQTFKNINELLAKQEGIKASQLTKLHHISIDGKVTFEDDANIIATIQKTIAGLDPVSVNFGEVKSYPGLTVYLSITNPDDILEFNKTLMTALGVKTTKLKLHLTLARYAQFAYFDKFTEESIPYPTSAFFDKIVIYKRPYKSKEKYQIIATLSIGDDRSGL